MAVAGSIVEWSAHAPPPILVVAKMFRRDAQRSALPAPDGPATGLKGNRTMKTTSPVSQELFARDTDA
jgi:hypothetical protein